MSEKFCIFCGKKPKDKNQEHVIPQWLIRMTGLEKEEALNVHPDKNKHIPFMRFTFPACTECNSKFAKMEAAVKPVLERVLSGQSISGADASLLMDWFDKVRIGLWLVNLYYDKDLKYDVGPRYYIDFGVAKQDRMLSIQKLNLKEGENKGIYWFGTNTHLFKYCPVGFTMLINDYYFFSGSTLNLVSSRVGFPRIVHAKVFDSNKGLLEVYTLDNRYNKYKKVVNPIVQAFTPNLEAVTFYQPIYRDFIDEKGLVVDEYMQEHSYNEYDGLGGVFVQKGFAQKAKYLPQNEKVSMKLKPVALPNFKSDMLKFQNAVQTKAVVDLKETAEGVRLNAMLLKSMQKQK